MELTRKSRIGGGLTALLVSLAAFAQSACSSDDSSSPGDASADSSMQAEAAFDGPAPPLGVPVSSCAGCPVCGGVLGSPTTGITYCTENCDAGSDCPTGTACVPNQTSSLLRNECIRTCTSNADCTAPFICRSDLVSPGSFCWSPYPAPATSMPDSGTATDAGDAGTVDSGTPADTGAPDAGPDSGPTDAGDAGDGS
jgi:hypothetical protein